MMESTHVPRCSCSRYLWAVENGRVKYMSKAGKTPQLFSLKSFKIILTFYQTWVGSLLRLRAALLQSPRNGGRRGLSIKEDKLTHLNPIKDIVVDPIRIRDVNTATSWSQVGLQFAAKACFDVREAPALWGLMELIAEVYLTATYNLKEEGHLNCCTQDPIEVDTDLEFLSTHPVHPTRYPKITKKKYPP